MEYRNLKILFVEDDTAFMETISYYLHAQRSHDVTMVDTVERARNTIDQHKFDFVILDYLLPDGSGLEVLRHIGERKIDTPSVMLTGHGCEEVAVDAMKLGAYDYVNKVHISIDYVPILIDNVYERYVLRNEALLRQRELLEKEKHNAVVEVFKQTVTELSDKINHLLQKINKDLEGARAAKVNEEREDFYIEIERQIGNIKSVLGSLMTINSMISGKMTEAEPLQTIQSKLTT
jgi:DNA-binding NtrC family response regulator